MKSNMLKFNLQASSLHKIWGSCVTTCGDITFAAPTKIHALTQFKQHLFHRCFPLVNSRNQKFEGFFLTPRYKIKKKTIQSDRRQGDL